MRPTPSDLRQRAFPSSRFTHILRLLQGISSFIFVIVNQAKAPNTHGSYCLVWAAEIPSFSTSAIPKLREDPLQASNQTPLPPLSIFLSKTRQQQSCTTHFQEPYQATLLFLSFLSLYYTIIVFHKARDSSLSIEYSTKTPGTYHPPFSTRVPSSMTPQRRDTESRTQPEANEPGILIF